MNDLFFNKELHLNKSFTNQNHDAGVKDKEFTKILYVGNVVTIDDELDANRIIVRIPELDNNIIDSELPICYPMFGQLIKNLPNKGEAVYIMVSDPKKPYNDRLWIIPIIRQNDLLSKDNNNDQNSFVGISGYYEKYLKGVKSLNLNPESNGIIPKDKNKTVIYEGRDNSDLIFGDNSIRFRFGYQDNKDKKKLNKTNVGNIFLINDKDNNVTTSVIQSNKILLLSHNGTPKPKVILENASDVANIFEKSHPLLYGDLVVSLLGIIRTCIINHYHPSPTFKPIMEDYIKKLNEFDLNSLLSNNIKIN